MNAQQHHPHADTLMSFAAGSLESAFALVVSCHLHFCGRCRALVRSMETLGGVLLSGHEPAGADDDGFFQRTMARFNEEAKGHGAVAAHSLWRPRQSTKLDPGDAIMMPAPLAGLTGLRRDSVVWKPAMQGVSSLAIPAFPEKEGLLHLLKMEPGSVLPDEFHDGSHLILVLWGAYESEQGRFERGDLADIEPETTHRFHANHPEGATCVVATDAHAGHLHAWAL